MKATKLERKIAGHLVNFQIAFDGCLQTRDKKERKAYIDRYNAHLKLATYKILSDIKAQLDK